ncbi:MAG TPA: ClbS/DfsB family four-helix bundle protein [Candidatus Nitrosotalea sp.]|nr:ClbS/DfsB family four-helix bundle protein [Candidatus Nitrosotalea sp.]
MLRDPVIWLFGLSVALLVVGVLGVILSTRRDREREQASGTADIELGAQMIRFHELQAEIKRLSAEGERVRAERDELQAVLARLSSLLERAPTSGASRWRRRGLRVSQPAGPGVSEAVDETHSTGEAPMSDKAALLREAAQAFGELRESIQGMSDDEMRRVWLGSWGVREILIHISGWHDEMAPALGRIAKGEAAYPAGTYDDFDAWNARFVDRKSSVKTADVLAELEASHRAFLAAAAAVPDRLFAPGGGAREPFEGAGAGHYREHTAQIRQWRQAKAS